MKTGETYGWRQTHCQTTVRSACGGCEGSHKESRCGWAFWKRARDRWVNGRFDRRRGNFMIMKGGERWPRSVIGAMDKHMTGAEAEVEKSHSQVESWRTRTCVGESGVEGGMDDYMRLSGGGS